MNAKDARSAERAAEGKAAGKAEALVDAPAADDTVAAADGEPAAAPYMQNRELSWLTFNERVLDQGSDETVPLLERLNFISIFWSNLQEFFMVRVGSLTDLSLVKKPLLDSKTLMTPAEQLDAIYNRCHELYPVQERTFEDLRVRLGEQGVSHLRPEDLDDEQSAYLADYVQANVMPFLSPQIINSRHPFPHLENGALYVVVRLDEEAELGSETAKAGKDKAAKAAKADKAAAKQGKKPKNLGAEGVTLGLVPMPGQCERVIALPGKGYQFILLEHAIEMVAADIFSMYTVKHANVICVTRNADLDTTERTDESDDDYREHMKRILKKRSRLAPVRLESERELSDTVRKLLLKRLSLKSHQIFTTTVPLDMSYTFGLASRLPEKKRATLTNPPFSPQWPATIDHARPIIDQAHDHDLLLFYPYESMDPFVQLLREAAHDPAVISIKITLYRLASQSHLAEALIAAAEAGKEVTALFELRARFDESNNIEWSQRFEEAGAKVIYGFRDFKVHSKICCVTRQTDHGLEHITQLGTGNYNEKTAKLYTDLSFITCDATFGRDAVEFFRNMGLENTSDNYDIMWVAPLQIKPMILANIDREIERARAGEPCGLFFKTNSVTDKDIIEKIVEASQAGVPTTLFVRGISCIVPKVAGFTENVRVVSIVGRLLEHSRVYGFGPRDTMRLYLSSADLMTRNMDKRIEIAWPILGDDLREQILGYLDVCLDDTAKLRELLPDRRYTPLGAFAEEDENGETILFDSQEYLIKQAQDRRLAAAEETAARAARLRAQVAAAQAASAASAGNGGPEAEGAPEAATADTLPAAAGAQEPAAAGKPDAQRSGERQAAAQDMTPEEYAQIAAAAAPQAVKASAFSLLGEQRAQAGASPAPANTAGARSADGKGAQAVSVTIIGERPENDLPAGGTRTGAAPKTLAQRPVPPKRTGKPSLLARILSKFVR